MRIGPALTVLCLPISLFVAIAAAQPAPTEQLRVSLLAEKLNSTDGSIRRAAAVELGDMGAAAAPAAPALVAASKDKDIAVRAEVASALLRIGEGAIPAIKEGLADPSAGIALALVLSKMGNPGLVALVDRIAHGNDAAQGNALIGIGSLGAAAKRSLPVLVELFRSNDAAVRGAAAQAVAKMAEANRAIVVPAVAAALRDPDPGMRLGAIATAGALGSDGVSLVPALVERLADTQPDVQKATQDALFQMGPPALPALRPLLASPGVAAVLSRFGAPAIPFLTEALGGEPPAVRIAAATGLAGMGSAAASAAESLGKALHDVDADVRVSVAQALAAIGSSASAANAALASALADPSPAVRAAAATAIGQTDKDGRIAAPALVKALDDPVADVQRAAADSLRRAGARAVPGLLDGLKEANASRVVEALTSVGPSGVREISAGLRHPDARARAGAAEALGRLGAAAGDAAAALVETLKDPVPDVRAAAARALGRMAPQSAAVAVPSLTLLVKDQPRAVRLAAIVALGQMRTAAASAAKALSSATHDDDPDVRTAATNARQLVEGH